MTAAKRILIVEDEPTIADTLIYVLNSSGYQTEHVGLLQTALSRLQTDSFSLAILDVGLPDGNGFDLCRQIRRFSDIPVIFLTAHGDEIDRIVGLEIGADDYVTKPFSPREVAARVGVILRRLGTADVVNQALKFPGAVIPAEAGIQRDNWAPTYAGATIFEGRVNNKQTPAANTPFDLDSQAGRIRYCGHLLELTRYEFLLLKLLIENPERIFSREQLLARIWQDPGDVFDRTVDTHIKTLRAKLRLAAADQDPIRTHRGLGYSLQSR
ncbi:response regulator [Methylomonas fluvii]|uniref:Response regulator n=1 Tax=Methylomonas fluvii TaxID=1854564 RepID=A0ABR9DKH2_9GAMM|nr:response regulator [Methylomonas fluvii]MBD9363616.1 response regulator [Methylomonas fluvii]CAD6876916.1 Response regulator CreB of two-component signal transduction system CreBC [Methylomonas fluvii]